MADRIDRDLRGAQNRGRIAEIVGIAHRLANHRACGWTSPRGSNPHHRSGARHQDKKSHEADTPSPTELSERHFSPPERVRNSPFSPTRSDDITSKCRGVNLPRHDMLSNYPQRDVIPPDFKRP